MFFFITYSPPAPSCEPFITQYLKAVYSETERILFQMGEVFLWRFFFLVVELNTDNAFLRNLRNDANTFAGPLYGKSGQILKVKSKTRYSSRKNANISMQYFYTCVKTNSTD